MRYLPVVLHALIQLVPAGETELIQDLNLHLEANRYRAPEICDWGGVAQVLFKHLNKREEIPWVAALLAVWTDQPNAQKLIDALSEDIPATPQPRFYIVNDIDCPNAEHVAECREDGKFYYAHPSLRRAKRYWGMTPKDPTPLEDFGIQVRIEDGVFFGKLSGTSCAKYRDGRPRRWQGDYEFSFPFSDK